MADRRIDELTALTSLATGDELIVADASEANNNLKTKKMTLSTVRSWLQSSLSLSAARITSGVLSTARIPGLAASKITSGILALARIPDLPASKITSGKLDAARLPDGVGGGFNPTLVFSGNVTVSINTLRETTGVWPPDADWLIVQINTTGSSWEGWLLFFNPRIGHAPNNRTPVTAASDRSSFSDDNSIGVVLTSGTTVFFGRTSSNNILVGASASSVQPMPLNIYKL